MSRLLRADFSRLFKSLIFKLGMIFSVGFAVVMVMARYIDLKVNASTYAEYGYMIDNVDDFIFVGCFFMIFVVAVFIGIFVGTDYSDGTIRNKIMVGHKRGSIYLANYITCYAAMLIFNFTYIVTVLVFGLILYKNTTIKPEYFFVNLGFMIITSAALTALLLFFAMLINNKAAASVTLLAMAIVLWFFAMLIVTRLDTQEYYQDVYELNEAGEIVQDKTVRNPKYLTGVKREIYEFMEDFLPSTQYYQVLQWNIERPVRFILCDVGIFVVMTGAGVVAFRRKDLK